MTAEPAVLHEPFKPNGRWVRSEVFRAAIEAVESLTRADPHLPSDDDPDSIHAARVATRKLRSGPICAYFARCSMRGGSRKSARG